jgi:hypothetical protein
MSINHLRPQKVQSGFSRFDPRKRVNKGREVQVCIEVDMFAIQRNPALVKSFFRAPYIAYIAD